jgi:hypothetical protein
MSRFNKYIEETLKEKKKCKKKKKEMNEAVTLRFGGYHLRDNILDEITVEELQTMIDSNVPIQNINTKTAQKEFDDLLMMKVRDARAIAKKVIPDLVKDFIKNKE